jgi:hypothetical protein
VEDAEIDRFWVFLEALAGFLESSQSIEALKNELSQMPQPERDQMTDYLKVVAEKVPLLVACSD